MRDALRLGRIAGVAIGVHWSVLLMLLLVADGLAESILPEAASGRSPAAYWSIGAGASVLFLLSLLAHELAHAVVAKRNGVEVAGITLWMLGGMARLEAEPRSPGADLRIASVGPVTSLVLGVLFIGGAVGGDALGWSPLFTASAMALGVANVLLGLFNLLPGAPLDGGRVLRGLLWLHWRDRQRAAVAATNAGQGIGWALAGVGVALLFAGQLVIGLWWLLIGWFLVSAARGERTYTIVQSSLHDVLVRDVMTPDPVVGPSWFTVEAFLERVASVERVSAFPILDFEGQLVGLVTVAQLARVPAAVRAEVTAGRVATPIAEVPTAAPEEPVTSLLERMSPGAQRALVLADGLLVGIITTTDITRTLQLAAGGAGVRGITAAAAR